jgi:hypothetical protein
MLMVLPPRNPRDTGHICVLEPEPRDDAGMAAHALFVESLMMPQEIAHKSERGQSPIQAVEPTQAVEPAEPAVKQIPVHCNGRLRLTALRRALGASSWLRKIARRGSNVLAQSIVCEHSLRHLSQMQAGGGTCI